MKFLNLKKSWVLLIFAFSVSQSDSIRRRENVIKVFSKEKMSFELVDTLSGKFVSREGFENIITSRNEKSKTSTGLISEIKKGKKKVLITRLEPKLNKKFYDEQSLREAYMSVASQDNEQETEGLISEMATYGIFAAKGLSKGEDVITADLNEKELEIINNIDKIATVEILPIDSGPSPSTYPPYPDFSDLVVSAEMGPMLGFNGFGIKSGNFEVNGIRYLPQMCSQPNYAPVASHNGSLIDINDLAHTEGVWNCATSRSGADWKGLFRKNLNSDFNDIRNIVIQNSIQIMSASQYDANWNTGNNIDLTSSTYRRIDELGVLGVAVFLPTHNLGLNRPVQWQSYNIINVGNVQHRTGAGQECGNDYTQCFQISGVNFDADHNCMQRGNPKSVYGNCRNIQGGWPTCSSDRELPHLVAPGVTPWEDGGFQDPCVYNDDASKGLYGPTCGTSFSSPIAMNIGRSVLQSLPPYLRRGEILRSILLLTAMNLDDYEYYTYNRDNSDGAGTISGSQAINWTTSFSPVDRECGADCAVEKGLNRGIISTYSPFMLYGKIPSQIPNGKHLRVVLTWNSQPNPNSQQNPLSDIDLSVRGEGFFASSSSWDNNVEMVDVYNGYSPNQTFSMSVSPFMIRNPSSGPQYTNYSLVWGFVANRAP